MQSIYRSIIRDTLNNDEIELNQFTFFIAWSNTDNIKVNHTDITTMTVIPTFFRQYQILLLRFHYSRVPILLLPPLSHHPNCYK